MQKAAVVAIMALGLAVYAQASSSNDAYGVQQKFDAAPKSAIYTSVGVTVFAHQESKVLDIQPVDEIVGEGGTQFDVKFGFNAFQKTHEKDKARVYTYLWSTPDKNSEVGFGMGAEYLFEPFAWFQDLQLLIGAQVGYGWQGVKGDTKRVSTSADKFSYLANSSIANPTEITYTDDSYVLDINLLLGSSYHISKNLDLDIGYVYKNSRYQVAYRTAHNAAILNALTFSQDSHGVRVGLNYKF